MYASMTSQIIYSSLLGDLVYTTQATNTCLIMFHSSSDRYSYELILFSIIKSTPDGR